tara:strand:- start:152 stop:361 length:210 start_codon:yes stop_codon:yes gene_type:complete
MKIISKQLIKTYKELDKTLDLMQKDKGVSPFVFRKILNIRSNIHNIIINSLGDLNSKEALKILNLIKKI